MAGAGRSAAMILAYNERIKLRANAFDRASTASIAVGVFGPFVGHQFTPTGAILNAIFWLSLAAVLHLLAYKTLEDLYEEKDFYEP